MSKAERTKQYIIERVAPVFNKMGYFGTSLSDITEATGLTKGAIYGNFENKEDLAIEAFNYNIRKLVWKVADEINAQESATDKIKALTDFYRKYYQATLETGGCPLLNVGIDTNNTNPALHARVVQVIKKLQKSIADIISLGVESGEFKKTVDPEMFGARILSQVQGGIYAAVILRDQRFLVDVLDHLDRMIETELLM